MLLQTLAALSAFIPLALAATDASIVSTTDSISTTDQATINTFVKKCGGTGSVCGCSVLTSVFGSSQVFAPGSATYQKEAAYYWDSREIVAPKCVFVPTSTASLAKAMAVFTGSKSPFAVRGGGHMPV
jgi:hypothetical protein